MPKIFKWYKDDFGFSKQEILAYYASFMQPDVRSELTEIARSNNFLIKYDKYDWNLNLTKACSEAARQPVRQLITNSPSSGSPARQQQPAPSLASVWPCCSCSEWSRRRPRRPPVAGGAPASTWKHRM